MSVLLLYLAYVCKITTCYRPLVFTDHVIIDINRESAVA